MSTRSERRIRQFGSIAASRVNDRKRLAAKEGRQYIPQAERLVIARAKRQARTERLQSERDARAAYKSWRDLPHVKAWFQAQQRKTYQSDSEKDRARFKKRYYENLQAERLRATLYKHANPDKVVKHGNKRKQLAADYADGTATHDAVGQLFARAVQCPYCGSALTAENKSLDHIVPLSRGGPHSLFNLLICCDGCNSRKRAKVFDEWLVCLAEPFKSKCERMYRRRFRASPKQNVLALPFS